VDLPDPFEPRIAVFEPVSKVCETPCKMCCLPNFFCNPSSTIIALGLLSDQPAIAVFNKA